MSKRKRFKLGLNSKFNYFVSLMFVNYIFTKTKLLK